MPSAQKLVCSSWFVVRSFLVTSLVITLLFGVFQVFTQPAFAQEGTEEPPVTTTEPSPEPSPSPSISPAPGLTQPVVTPPPCDPADRVKNPNGCAVSKENYKAPQNVNYTVLNLEHTILCEFVGGSPVDTCLGSKKNGQLIVFNGGQGGGATGALAGVIGTLYSPPTSTVQYLAGVFKNFGFAEPAYAQTIDVPGSGAGIISPIFTLWQAVRNVSYLAFILIFLGVGFMIMFKQKINPQTVVTAQAALPGLVIGLALVTFSYLIAAAIIDLAFLGVPLVTNIIVQANPTGNAFGDAAQLDRLARDSNILQMFGTTIGSIDTGKIAEGTFGTIWSTPATITTSALIGAIVGGIVGSMFMPGLGTAIGAGIGGGTGWVTIPGVISLIIPLILIVALIIQMFKLLMALISTYLQILIATLTGPFVILGGSLPGRGGAIGQWLKTLLANALVFPAVFAAFLFAGMILATDAAVWKASPPLFGGLSIDLIGVLLGYGVLMALPAIPEAVRGAFGIKPQQGGIAGAALGGFTTGFGVLKGATTKGYGTATGNLKREKETYQKEKAQAAVGKEGGGVTGWKERLFKRGLPF